HVGSERLVDGGAQAGVVIRLGPAQARGDGQLANQLGEDLAFLRILTGFAMFDVRPLGMTSHKNRLICAWITLILRCKVTTLTTYLSAARRPYPDRSATSERLGVGFGLAQTNIQFAQLLGVHRTGGVRHQTGSRLRLRKRDDIANRFGAGHQHHQPIETESQATVWRRTIFQGIEQEAKLLFGLFRANTQHAEYGFLHLAVMNTDRAAT